MDKDNSPQWLQWAREIQALSQTGLAFAGNEYEKARNTRLIELAAEITAAHTELEQGQLTDVFMQQGGYATPKIDVRSVVVHDGKLLLVQESADSRWAMPGGWADVGDFPSQVAERETLEESGYIVKARKLIGVYDANRAGRPMELFHAFKLLFLCELIGGEARPSNETLDVGFFNFDKLPPLSQNRTNEMHIEEIKHHLNNPGRPAYFD